MRQGRCRVRHNGGDETGAGRTCTDVADAARTAAPAREAGTDAAREPKDAISPEVHWRKKTILDCASWMAREKARGYASSPNVTEFTNINEFNEAKNYWRERGAVNHTSPGSTSMKESGRQHGAEEGGEEDIIMEENAAAEEEREQNGQQAGNGGNEGQGESDGRGAGENQWKKDQADLEHGPMGGWAVQATRSPRRREDQMRGGEGTTFEGEGGRSPPSPCVARGEIQLPITRQHVTQAGGGELLHQLGCEEGDYVNNGAQVGVCPAVGPEAMPSTAIQGNQLNRPFHRGGGGG